MREKAISQDVQQTLRHGNIVRTAEFLLVFTLLLFVLYSCAREYKFIVDAPAKYPSNMTFKTMRIEDFSTQHIRYGSYLKNMVASWTANEGYIRVVNDRPDAVVTGSLDIGKIVKNIYSSSYDCSYKDKNGNRIAKTCTLYSLNKKATIAGNFQMYSTAHRQIVIGDSKSYTFDDTWLAESIEEANSKSLNEEEILNLLLKQMARDIVYSITPHKEEVKKKLMTGSDSNIKLGIVYLMEGRAEQAISIWDQVSSHTSNDSDKAASYYNIGVIKESRRDYRDAFEAYSKANTLMPKEKLYIRAMTEAENLYKQQNRVLEQASK